LVGSPWKYCLERLEGELSPQQFNTWIRPLHAIEDSSTIRLLAPNRFVMDWVREQYLSFIKEILKSADVSNDINIDLEVGSQSVVSTAPKNQPKPVITQRDPSIRQARYSNNLNQGFTFDTFVEGKSNQLARAASEQVAENPGNSYNPLFIYGGVGLGKTHLMHAIGHSILQRSPNSNISYLHSERFVADMVKALQ
jgi:chromosomal replication initiator protein